MNSSNHFYWNTGPELASFGSLTIGWYGLFFASGFYLGFHIMRWVFKRESKSINTLDNLFIFMVLGAVVGARLGHCIFYNPEFYFSNPLEIIKIWKGGLASHGGAVGMLIAMYTYAKKTENISFYWLLDRMTLPIALGSFFIRMGNFFNSEIIGIPTDVPWAIVFTRIDALPRHPAQLYEAIVYLLVFITLFIIYRKQSREIKPGLMMGLLMVCIFGSRFFLEYIKIPQEAFEPILSLNMGQWLSIPFVLLGSSLIYFSHQRANEISNNKV